MLLNFDAIKKCSKCKKELPITEFTKSRYSKDGYRYQCKSCNQAYQTIEKKSEWSNRYYVNHKKKRPEHFIWKQARHRAFVDYNGMEFSITPEDIKIPETCPYLKIPLSFFGERKQAPSLDRIDSTKGYTKDNIQVISCMANIMKSNASIEELVEFAKGVLEVHSKEVGRDASEL